MIISDHAKERMLKKSISEHEVKACLDFGELQATNYVEGEKRHLKRLDFKDKSVAVVYTTRDDEIRIITVYTIRKWRK